MSNPDSTAPPKLDYFVPERSAPAYTEFGPRLLALIVDGFILVISTFAILIGVMQTAYSHGYYEIASFNPPLWWKMTTTAFQWGSAWLYCSGLESSRWQATLGKRFFAIQVTDLNGQRISFQHATVRFAARFVSAAPLCAGFLLAGLTKKRQALHDIIAKTLVVRRRR